MINFDYMHKVAQSKHGILIGFISALITIYAIFPDDYGSFIPEVLRTVDMVYIETFLIIATYLYLLFTVDIRKIHKNKMYIDRGLLVGVALCIVASIMYSYIVSTTISGIHQLPLYERIYWVSLSLITVLAPYTILYGQRRYDFNINSYVQLALMVSALFIYVGIHHIFTSALIYKLNLPSCDFMSITLLFSCDPPLEQESIIFVFTRIANTGFLLVSILAYKIKRIEKLESNRMKGYLGLKYHT